MRTTGKKKKPRRYAEAFHSDCGIGMRTVDCRFRLIDGVPVRLQKEKEGL